MLMLRFLLGYGNEESRGESEKSWEASVGSRSGVYRIGIVNE